MFLLRNEISGDTPRPDGEFCIPARAKVVKKLSHPISELVFEVGTDGSDQNTASDQAEKHDPEKIVVKAHPQPRLGVIVDVLPALKDGDSFDRLRKGGQRAVPADGPEAPCKGTATSRLTVQAMRSF